MASKRHLRKKMCTRKQRYLTMDDAQIGAGRINAVFKTHVFVYKCTFCKGWHVGHPPRIVRDQMIAKGVRV